jgi:hypothetical protein
MRRKLSGARCANAHPLMSCSRGDEVCSTSCDATSPRFPVDQPNKVATVKRLNRPCHQGIDGITGLTVLRVVRSKIGSGDGEV